VLRRDRSDNARRPLGEIAFAAGFNDLSHFTRACRARYGCAPRDARRVSSPLKNAQLHQKKRSMPPWHTDCSTPSLKGNGER
jgi:AraC-like DNA-binding protein